MAPKKLVFVKKGDEGNKPQITDDAEEESNSDSDIESEKGKGAAPVPPKKPIGSSIGLEPVENGSACSSPSVSGFIILPAVKYSEIKKKKTPASKKFCDEDETALLKGLADFWADGKNNKWTEFHQFIKDELTNQFSKVQVSEKIRALKKKFETNSERARANGGRLDFSDAHESLMFELSKALWGDEKGVVQETNKRAETENEEASEKPRKRKQVDEHDEVFKITIKREQVDEHDENKKISKQGKQVDDIDEKNMRKRKGKHVAEHDENKNIFKQGKQVNDHDETEKMSKQGKEVDEHHQEKNITKKGKQAMEIGVEDFQLAYPLLYASFDKFGYPKIAKESCVFIAREKAQELEEKWRELTAEASRLELKKIDLTKRDFEDRLQRK